MGELNGTNGRALRRSLIATAAGLVLTGAAYAAGDWVVRINRDHEHLAVLKHRFDDVEPHIGIIPELRTAAEVLSHGQSTVRTLQEQTRQDVLEMRRGNAAKFDRVEDKLDRITELLTAGRR